jgi:peroxiredoxin Q/BCP
MPVELRKRKAVEAAPAPPAKKKSSVSKAVEKVKAVVTGSPQASKTNGASSATKVAVGDTIDLENFGGEVETHDGVKTSLKALVDDSKGGVVLFTYPAASTPGCTKQACGFRDSYEPLTATGFSIFGLSKDSQKSNTNFKEKQKLPYTLLCDPKLSLINAIGLKNGTKTTRGVFVVDKSGKVLAAEAGSPEGTITVVKKLVGGGDLAAAAPDAPVEPVAETKTEEAVAANGVETNGSTKEDVAQADVAAQVADTAEKLDSNEAKTE